MRANHRVGPARGQPNAITNRQASATSHGQPGAVSGFLSGAALQQFVPLPTARATDERTAGERRAKSPSLHLAAPLTGKLIEIPPRREIVGRKVQVCGKYRW
jgi:hypothetical protein